MRNAMHSLRRITNTNSAYYAENNLADLALA
jgi:hypothetical protein